jgi:ubiquitin-conjugating enzyme E2 D/E
VLIKVCELFNEPNAADPLVGSIAQLYLNNREEHDRIAKEWTERYGT